MKKTYATVLLGLIGISIMSVSGFSQEKDLGTIVVTPTRTGLSEMETPTNVTVITREDIATSGAQDLGELLEDFSTIKVGRNGDMGSVSSLSIRGSTAEQVLVMIDGRPVNDTAFGTPQPHQLLLSHIERIEIVRGGASSLYGANAVGGVINLITRTPKSDKPITDVGITYGSLQKKLYHLGYGIKKKFVDLYIAGDRQTAEGYRKNEDLKLNHVFARAGFDLKKFGTIVIKGDIFQNKISVPGPNYTPLDQWNGSIEKEATTLKDKMNSDNRYGLFEHEIVISDCVRVRSRAYGNIDERKLKFSTPSWDFLNENKSLGTEIQLDIPLNITMGGDYRRDSLLQKYILTNQQISNNKFINRAFYIQQKFTSEYLTAIPGIRFDNHSNYDSETNPRVLLIYQLNPAWTASLNASRAFRAPTFNEIMYNAGVKPEFGKTYDIGIKTAGKDISSHLTLFLTDTKDLIVWQPNILTLMWEPDNIPGTTRSQGIECGFSQKLFTFMKHRVDYTYNSVKNRITRKTIYYKPAHKVQYAIELFNKKGFKTIIRAEGIGKQYTNQNMTAFLPGYGLLDVRLSQQMHSMTIAFGIDNLLDKRYVTRDNYPLAGRTISATVSVSFLD